MREDESSNPGPKRLRLDLFLKWSGLIRRRTMSKWLCERGSIRVNEHVAKPGRAVTAGDRIAIQRGDRRLMVEVLDLPAWAPSRRSKSTDSEGSHEWYRVINRE